MGLVLDFPYVLEHPYVSVAEFRRHPTFLDSQNLVTAGTGPDQDAALRNILLTASQLADDKVNMPLAAHVRTEQVRLFPTPSGQLRYHPDHAPVLEVLSMGSGPRPGEITATASPSVWIEHNGRVVIATTAGGSSFGPALQFGGPPAGVGGEVMVTWTYVAGYPATQLTAAAADGATTLAVRDTTGIKAGSVLRLWTPGLEETVTVGAVAGNTLTLASPLTLDHKPEDTCSALPPSVRQAVINFAVVLLMRPASGVENEMPTLRRQGGQLTPEMSSTANDRGRNSGGSHLFEHACKLLKPYKRIR